MQKTPKLFDVHPAPNLVRYYFWDFDSGSGFASGFIFARIKFSIKIGAGQAPTLI